PICRLFFQTATATATERIESRPTIALSGAPLGKNPALQLQTLQRRVERTLLHAEHAIGNLPQTLGNGPAVHRLQGQSLQDQKIQRALQEVHALTHGDYCRRSTIEGVSRKLSARDKQRSVKDSWILLIVREMAQVFTVSLHEFGRSRTVSGRATSLLTCLRRFQRVRLEPEAGSHLSTSTPCQNATWSLIFFAAWLG